MKILSFRTAWGGDETNSIGATDVDSSNEDNTKEENSEENESKAKVDSEENESLEINKDSIENQDENESEELGKMQSLQELINALPDAESITEENSEDIISSLETIDKAKEELTEEENSQIDYTRYDAVVAKLLEQEGQHGADETMPVEDNTTGGFSITGGTYGTDYTFDDGVLTIISDKEMSISTSEKTDNIICIRGNVTAKLTFDNVKIQSNKVILTLEEGSTLELNLTGDNSLVSNASQGILMKDNTQLTVKSITDGSLYVCGGGDSAIRGATAYEGIKMDNSACFTLESGIVRVVGGHGNCSKTIFELKPGIYGGTVNAKGGYLQAESQVHYYDWTPCTVEAISGGSFKSSGDAVVVAKYQGIKDFDFNDTTNLTGGLIINGSDAYVFGNQTLSKIISVNDDALALLDTITVDKTLTVPEDVTLIVAEGTTLDIKGTLINNGKIINNGTINYLDVEGNGTIEGNSVVLYGDGKIDLSEGSIEITDTGYTVGTQKYIYGSSFKGDNFTIDGQDNTPTGNRIKISKSCTVKLKDVTIGTDSASTSGNSPLIISSNITVGLNIDGTAYIGDGWDGYHTNNIVIGNNSSLTVEGGTLKCTENASCNKVALGTSASMIVKSGEVDLRSSYVPVISGNGTFTVDGGKVKLRSDPYDNAGTGEICQNEVSFELNQGSVDIYNDSYLLGDKSYVFGANLLKVNGGKLTSSLSKFTLNKSFILDGGTIDLAGSITGSVKNSSTLTSGLVIEGNTVTVYGNYILTEDFILQEGKTLTIPADALFTVGKNTTLTNRGTIKVENGGSLTITGDAINTGNGKLEVAATGTVNKKDQAAPYIWNYSYTATDKTIIVSSSPEGKNGIQYSLDGGNSYQDSAEFTNLTPNTGYTLKIKYPGNDYYKDSESGTRTVYTSINQSGLYVAGEDVSAGGHWLVKENKLTADGASNTNFNVYYDKDTQHLTLRDFAIAYSWSPSASAGYDYIISGIYAPSGVKQINIEGDCQLTDDAYINVNSDLKIVGSGNLESSVFVEMGKLEILLSGKFSGDANVYIDSDESIEKDDTGVIIEAAEIKSDRIQCFNGTEGNTIVSLDSTQGNINVDGVFAYSYGNSQIQLSSKGDIIANKISADVGSTAVDVESSGTSTIDILVASGHQAIFAIENYDAPVLQADTINFPDHAIVMASSSASGENVENWTEDNNDNYKYVKIEKLCNLSVTNGTGTAYYKAGDSVTVQANAASNLKTFKDWSGLDVNGIEITSGSKTTTTICFKMPKADMELIANYEDISTDSSSSDNHHSSSNNSSASSTPTSSEANIDTITTEPTVSTDTASKSSAISKASSADNASKETLTNDGETVGEDTEESKTKDTATNSQEEDASDTSNASNNTEGTSSVSNGDNSSLLLLILLIVAIAGLLFILIYKQRKSDDK